jgi:phosphatidylglycerophosphatase A
MKLPPDEVSEAKVLAEQPLDPATAQTPEPPRAALAPRRATVGLMLSSPLHLLSLGFGSGLSPMAPGTVGTLWAWGSFLVLDHWLRPAQWAWLLLAGLAVGWWACTRTAQALRTADPSPVVWDEILAFWLILWVISPASGWWQLAAFVGFRLFDAAKPGPVGWADRLYKLQAGEAPGWVQGWGILFDDLVAALCTLVVLALWKV